MIKSKEVSEEIVMDVFLKLWLGKELVSQIENIDAFLFRVAYNKSFNNAGQSGQFNGLTNVNTSELNLDGIIGASHNLTKDLHLDATAGIDFRTNNYAYTQLNGSQFIIPFLYTPNNVLAFGRSYSYYKKRVHSAYYLPDFSWKDMLYLSTTGRYDAFSTPFTAV
jgi:hypothetical protein